MYSDRKGNGQRLPRTKPSRQKPPGTFEREFVQGAFVRDFVLGLIKMGSPRCVTYFWGSRGCVTKCDKGGGGSKLAKNSVTHFMDGPIECLFVCLFVHPHENRSGSILVCLFCLHTCLFESGPFSFQFISQLSFEYSFIKSSF